jgi:hypothetical protein
MISSRRLILGGLLAIASAVCAAGTGEFCTLPNAQGIQTSYECAVKFTAQSTWLGSFKTWLNTNKTTGAMACFAPGTFTVPDTPSTNTNLSSDANRMVLRGVSGLRLCAPAGGATVEHKTVNASGSPLAASVFMPTLQVSTSSNVAIKGMTFKNSSVYATAVTSPVTRAVWADKSTVVQFVDSQFISPGKGTVTATDSTLTLSGATIGCAFHCLAGERSTGATKPTFTVANSQINLNRVSDPNDENTALWTSFSDFFISDTSFNFTTGQGLVAGVASTVDWVNLSNIAITGTTPQGRLKMFGWIPTAPPYSNVQVSYTGIPPVGRAYFCVVEANNPACETGHENASKQGALFRSRPDLASPFVVAPPPPAKVKQILTLNQDGVGLSWMRQTLRKNAATLSFLGSQAAGPWNGWLDVGDTALTGSFTAPGLQQVLLFNSDPQGGALSVRTISGTGTTSQMTTNLTIPWTSALVGYLGGWHDANDQLLAGDFMGLGRSQLLFFNKDPAGNTYFVATIDSATGQLQGQAWIPWTPELQTELNGYIDPEDKQVAGDFMGTGRAQLLFINTVGWAQWAAVLRQYDANTNSFVGLDFVTPNKIYGPNASMWNDTSTKILVGDFLGMGKDQLMLINPSGTGVALTIWHYDNPSAVFYQVYTMNWAAGEITATNFGGFLDAGDWQLGF